MATWTGVGRYTVGIARALAARDDIELVQVVAPDERPPVAPRDGARSIVARKHPFSLAGAREIGRIARSVDADVVHCTHFPTPMPAPHPLVVTVHDVMPIVVPGIMKSPIKRAVYRYWNARVAKLADRIVVPSRSTADDIARLFPLTAEKIRVTPEAADEFRAGPRGRLAPELADVIVWPYLLSMGSTRRHKDLPTLLHAFARVAPAHPDLRLLLVGDTDLAFVDSTLAGTPAEVRHRVLFTGRLADPPLRTLYAGAEVFVFPSRYEGFGLPPLEAMEMGAPVVVANASSLPEVVGEAALLFEPGDIAACAAAIESVLTQPALREQLIAAGYERAGGFSWAYTAELTVATYREVVAER